MSWILRSLMRNVIQRNTCRTSSVAFFLWNIILNFGKIWNYLKSNLTCLFIVISTILKTIEITLTKLTIRVTVFSLLQLLHIRQCSLDRHFRCISPQWPQKKYLTRLLKWYANAEWLCVNILGSPTSFVKSIFKLAVRVSLYHENMFQCLPRPLVCHVTFCNILDIHATIFCCFKD